MTAAEKIMDWRIHHIDTGIGGVWGESPVWLRLCRVGNQLSPSLIFDNNNPQYITIPFSEFSGIDFTKISSIQISMFPASGVYGEDFVFSSINVIPEPSTYVLFGTILYGCLLDSSTRYILCFG
jgi:hypothetical protein